MRNEFADVDTFYLGGVMGSPVRRSRSRGAIAVSEPLVNGGSLRRRARSKSRPRNLYVEPDLPLRGPPNGKPTYECTLLPRGSKKNKKHLTEPGYR